MAFRVLLLLLIAFPSYSAEVAGVKLEEKALVENASLNLNGAGLRKRAFFSVYVIGLYLPERKAAAGRGPVLQPPASVSRTRRKRIFRATLDFMTTSNRSVSQRRPALNDALVPGDRR